MKILLTPDQESTLWHFMDHMSLPSGKKYYSFPFYLQDHGDGCYERLTFDQLPEEAKEFILTQRGIKIPTE
jgi:hypothetical protein